MNPKGLSLDFILDQKIKNKLKNIIYSFENAANRSYPFNSIFLNPYEIRIITSYLDKQGFRFFTWWG